MINNTINQCIWNSNRYTTNINVKLCVTVIEIPVEYRASSRTIGGALGDNRKFINARPVFELNYIFLEKLKFRIRLKPEENDTETWKSVYNWRPRAQSLICPPPSPRHLLRIARPLVKSYHKKKKNVSPSIEIGATHKMNYIYYPST